MSRPAGPPAFHQRHWAVEGGEALGTLLVIHGLSEHSGRYQPMAEAARLAGFAVSAVDLHGHGESPGRRGHIHDFDTDHLGAVDALVRTVEKERPNTPLILVGHSLGGLIAARWAQRRVFARRLRGLVLVTPFVAPRVSIPGWKLAATAILRNLVPSFTLPTGIADEVLFRDPAERERFAADPLVQRRISAGHWAALTRERERLSAEAASLEVPTLMLLAGDDRVVSTEASRELASRMPLVTVIEYPEAYHALHHDPCAREVLRDVFAWSRARIEA